MDIIFIVSIIILLCVLFFVIKKLNKIKKEQKLSIEKLWLLKRKKYEQEIVELETQKGELLEYYNKTKTQIEKEIKDKQNFNQSLLRIREEELDRLIEEKRIEKEKTLEARLKLEEERKTLLLNTQFIQFTTEQDKEKERILKELDKIRNELEDFRIQREAVNQAILREKELQEKESFYKIDIPQSSQEDILVFEQIRYLLKNKEALSKLIWEVFIQRPTVEMIKRITGGRDISGVYKITYIKTGEAYIGKTTNIKTRLQNHCRTVIGLEGAAHSSLHTHMEKNGLWNYTFEILEEVPKDKLSEREKFYINLYGTTKQLNMREG